MLKEKTLKTMEGYEWCKNQKFDCMNSFNDVASEWYFLQQTIYPMFYKREQVPLAYPLVIGSHTYYEYNGYQPGKYQSPVYIIDNDKFECIFLVNNIHEYHTKIWEVSMIMKDEDWFLEKKEEFVEWIYKWKDTEICKKQPSLEEMPQEYRFEAIFENSKNFSISFEGFNAIFDFHFFMNFFRLYTTR